MLSPYRVLDLTDERGHLAGYLLAVLGADVIAIEPPEGSAARRLGPFVGDEAGPDRSLTHLAYNRGKRSVVADDDAIRELARTADVLIESAAPGELAARGLGYDDLAAANPALVYASITALGQDGPRADWAMTDLTVMAASGALAITGDEDRPPVRCTVPQGFHFGATVAADAVIAALIERANSGRGQHIDAAAVPVALLATQAGVLAAGVGSPVAQRTAGGAKVGDMTIRLVYPAKDGYVGITHVFGAAIGPATARLMEWVHEAGFCTVEQRDKDWVGYLELIDSGAESIESWEACKAAVEAFCLSRTKAELLEGALARRLLVAPIADPADVVDSAQFNARGYFDQVRSDAAGRDVAAPGPFAKASATPLRRLGPAPRLGQHTAEVLAERRPSPALAGRTARQLPLTGLKVLDFTWSIAGPHAVRTLADLGATVVKVESLHKPDGARGYRPVWDDKAGFEQSALYDTMNAGKLSLALDLSRPEARALIPDLVRWADVVTESYSPRAMPAWGFDYDNLRKLNPGLIMLSTCLCGQDGPLRDFAGYGNLGASLAGFYGLAGWPDRPPAGPFGAYTDYTSTHVILATLLAAIDHRRRTGEGQHLDISQAEAAMHFLSPALLDRSVNGRIMERAGNSDRDLAPHGVYPATGEDRWVAVVCQDDSAWPALCGVIGRADLAADASRDRRRPPGPPGRNRQCCRRLDRHPGRRTRSLQAPGGGRRRLPGAEQRRVPGRPPAQPPGPLRRS